MTMNLAMTKKRNRRKAREGFTLMEVMLVLVILAILAAMVVPMLSNTQQTANIRAAKSQIGLLKTPVESFMIDVNRYPSSDEGLNALRSAPSSITNATKWRGPYLENIPMDPWDKPYQYKQPGDKNTQTYDLWSNGPDGQSGTADDIGNWPDAAGPTS